MARGVGKIVAVATAVALSLSIAASTAPAGAARSGGGWDHNGTSLSGAAKFPRSGALGRRGGGWDLNGPSSTGSELDLSALTVESVELPAD